MTCEEASSQPEGRLAEARRREAGLLRARKGGSLLGLPYHATGDLRDRFPAMQLIHVAGLPFVTAVSLYRGKDTPFQLSPKSDSPSDRVRSASARARRRAGRRRQDALPLLPLDSHP